MLPGLNTPRSPKQPPRAPVGAVGALVSAIGFGVALWHGWDLTQDRYSAQDVAQSVDLNLAMDLSRIPDQVLSEDQLIERRERIHQGVQAQIQAEKKQTRSNALAGLIVGFVGLAQIWAARKLQSG